MIRSQIFHKAERLQLSSCESGHQKRYSRCTVKYLYIGYKLNCSLSSVHVMKHTCAAVSRVLYFHSKNYYYDFELRKSSYIFYLKVFLGLIKIWLAISIVIIYFINEKAIEVSFIAQYSQ